MMNKRNVIFKMAFGLLVFCLSMAPLHVSAVETINPVNPVNPGVNVLVEPDDLFPIMDEPVTSDLTLLHAGTVLDSNRWIQSFTKDSNYYYFVQMTNPDKGHLRITRVKYTAPHQYTKDHMDLLGFGHGTNIDCTVHNGRTYLWIGSLMDKKTKNTKAISCFRYVSGGIVRKKAGNTYKIRMKGRLKKAENVFPAVSQDGKYLFVRYTYQKKQYFQKYRIYSGCKIKNNHPLMKLCISATAGDFQGFDVYKNYIYTIEGSPTALFLSSFDKNRAFQSTIVRITNYKTASTTFKIITGAQSMSFREPEGIKVMKNRRVEILFVSNMLEKQRCNIYKLK